MPAVTFNLLDQFREDFLDGTTTVDLEYTGTPAGAHLKCMILSALTIDQNADALVSDCAVFTEVSGTGYTAGGNSLANASVTLAAGGTITVDAADPATWSQDAAGFSNARRAVIAYDNGGASTTWPIVGYSDDFGSDQGNVAGDFSVALNANGIFQSAR